MHVVMLYFDRYIELVLRAMVEDGCYPYLASQDPDDGLRALEASHGPCLLFTDSFDVNPVARDALTRLRASPALQGRVQVVGLIPSRERAREFQDQGLLDEVVLVPFSADKILILLYQGKFSLS